MANFGRFNLCIHFFQQIQIKILISDFADIFSFNLVTYLAEYTEINNYIIIH